MKVSALRIQISIALIVWTVIFFGCSSNEIEEPASEKPIYQFSVKEGKRIFLNLCSPCHVESGEGDGIYWAIDMDKAPADLTEFTPAQSTLIFETIKYGSEAQGKSNLCPPWKNNISDEDIEHIVSYVETLQ